MGRYVVFFSYSLHPHGASSLKEYKFDSDLLGQGLMHLLAWKELNKIC